MEGADENGNELSRTMIRVRKFVKLIFIMICYTALFITVVRQARWFLNSWTVAGANHVSLTEWIKCLRTKDCGVVSGLSVLMSLGLDLLLFALFMAQHSLLAERNLTGTYIHQKLFLEWKINGALYTIATAIALHFLMKYWTVVPVYIWNVPQFQTFCTVIHVIAWFTLYGTTLMQDMPELVGLHQVVFTNIATSRKSLEFLSMLKKQRHLGFVPFTILISVCSVMTLDRLLFLSIVGTYSYFMWRDPVSFEYIREMTNRKRTRLSGVGADDGKED